MTSEVNLREVHDFLIQIANAAGDMMTAAKPSTTATDEKKNSVDLVTETDQAVEKMVSERIRSQYPNYRFIGEETYKPGETELTEEPTFLCDPIDGTTNFVHGCYTSICISLGFLVNKIPSVGIVYNPFTKEMYTAIRGQGSYLRSPIHTTPVKLPLRTPEPLPGLSKSLVILEWGSDREGVNFEVKIETFRKLAASEKHGGKMVHNVRSFGSAALNFCRVAEGGCDLYWEGGCWAWDVAAGWVVLTEAGGIVADGNPGGNFEPAVDGRKYIAVRGANEDEQRHIVEELWDCIPGKMEY